MEIRALSTIHALTLKKDNVLKHNPTEHHNVEKAVINNKLSAAYVDKNDNKEVKDVKISNYEAAESDVRDVEKAADLAGRVSFNIVRFDNTAIDAQANQSKDKVQALLE